MTRARVLAAEAVFLGVSALALFGGLSLLPRALASHSAESEARAIAWSLLAAGLPVAFGVTAGYLTQGRAAREGGVRVRDFAIAGGLALGAVVVTALGGFAAPFVYLSYFVAVTMLMSVWRLRAGRPPFSLAMAVDIGAAVIVSAAALGIFFGQLIEIVTRIGR